MMNSCNTTNDIHPLFSIGSLKVFYTIPIFIICLIGLIENIFAFQTFLFSCINAKICRRHLIYLLILSFNGLSVSILLPIGICCSILNKFIQHINLCDIFILLSIIMNTFRCWISSALFVDIALFNIYVGTMRQLTSFCSIVISINLF
jgi:hypothetical protein